MTLKTTKQEYRARWVSPATLAAELQLSRATIWRMIKSGQLPPPVRLSARVLRWDWQEVESFIAARSGRQAQARHKPWGPS